MWISKNDPALWGEKKEKNFMKIRHMIFVLVVLLMPSLAIAGEIALPQKTMYLRRT